MGTVQVGLRAIMFAIYLATTAVALPNPVFADLTESEIDLLNELVFPGAINAVVKWPGPVRFAIVTENDEDAALAMNIVADVAVSLPGYFQDRIVLEKRVAKADIPLLRERSVLYIKSRPYDDLIGSLRPFFATLITNGDDVDQRISQAQSVVGPWQTTFGVNGTHEVVGVLVMIDSSVDRATKRLMLLGAVSTAVCPTLLLRDSDPGLFEADGEKLGLSSLGRDLFMLMLGDDVRPGMSKSEFSEIARRLH